jgi:uncharacterized membrane protein HdeD (DUF308 family)
MKDVTAALRGNGRCIAWRKELLMLHEPSWWMFAWRGAIALVFGVFVLALPEITFFSLAVFIGLFAIVGGVIAMGAGLIYRNRDEHWWVSLLLGLASVGIGIVALLYPDPTAVVLLVIIAAHGLAMGALDMVLAARLRRSKRGGWTLAAAGLIGVVFGLFAFAFLTREAWEVVVRATGVYATLTGVLLIAAAVRMKRRPHAEPVQEPRLRELT